jgi:hypothetical protein
MWTACDKDARDEGALVGRVWEPADWLAVSTSPRVKHHGTTILERTLASYD